MISTARAQLLRRLLRARDMLDNSYHENWPVSRLARLSGVSKAHFARAFKEAFGIPPHRYLLSRRVERASALLRDTDMSVTEIAFTSGWDSLGTFGRTFRDIVGDSPGRFREHARKRRNILGSIPPCFLSAGTRPDLRSAVSEKRGAAGQSKPAPQITEVA